MFSRQQAQTGKRVYGGVSQAPNRGQVSAAGAQGYIKRELRNKNRAGVQRRIGGDGKSDNRSAVAAKALGRRRKVPGSNNGGRPVVRPPSNGGRPIVKDENTGKSGPIVPGQGGAPPAPKPPPQVVVNPDGVLQLPYNQDFSMEQLGAITDANNQLAALNLESGQQAIEYGQSKRDTELAYDSLKKQTLNQNAAGGTAFSSKYGTAVAGNAGQFAQQMGGIEQDNSNFLANRGLQMSGIQSSLNQQLAALAQKYADSLNEEAGDLGFGNEEQGPAQPHPAPAPPKTPPKAPDKPGKPRNGPRPKAPDKPKRRKKKPAPPRRRRKR